MKTPYPLPSYFSTHLIPLIVVDAKTLAIKEVNKAALKAFGYSNTFLKAHSLDLLLHNNKELKRVRLPLRKTKKLANCIVQVKNRTLIHYDVFLHPLHQKTKRYLLLEWHQKSSPLVDNKAHAISPTDHFFKEAIQNSSIVSITDSKGTITFANEKFLAISGYSIDELIGKNHSIINSGYHSRKFWVDMWKTISKGKTWRAEVKNRAKDGSYYWVDTFIMPFVNEAGEITDFLSVRNDITQRKLGEEESHLITARLNEAMHFGRMGIAELSVETNQLELSTELLYLLGEDDSSPINIPLTDFLNKYVYPEDVSLIKSKIQEGLNAVTEAQQIVHVEFRVKTAQGNLLYIDAQGTFRKNGKALGILRDITKKRLAQQEALDKTHQIEMMLSGITDGFFALDHDLNFILVNSVFSELANMPIQEMIGKNLLELFPFMEGTTLLNAYREALRTKQSNQLDEINGLNEKQAFRIFIYPNPLGLFINFHDISSAKIAESKLRDTTELFNRLSENVPGVIYNFYLTPEGKEVFPFVSSGCEKFFEISAETLMRDGNALFEIIHPEDIEGLRTSIQKAFHTHEPWTYECRIITKSGVTKWIAGHSNPYIERNGDTYWYGYLQDITQQKLDQISIAESEIKNRLIIENSGEGILFTQPDGKILSANPEACRIFGMREDEIIALGRAGLVAEDPKSLSEILAKRKEQGAFQGEILMRRKGGEHFIAEISSKLFVDANGVLKGSIILRDITDRKKVEQVKAEMLQRFDSIIKHLPGFIYQYRLRPDGTSHFPYSSSAVRHFYSTDSETLAKDAAKVFDVIYPDDLKYVEQTIQRSANDLSVWQAEYRVTLSNGQLIWVEGKATPEKEADGSILWHGYISDITKRKEIEIKLQDSRNRLRAFFDSTEDSIVLLDHACNLLDYNTVAAQNAKNLFDQDMYPGQNISAYFVPGSKEVFFRDFTKALSGESVNTEFKLNLTEKDYSWWQFKYFPMWAEDGHVAGVSFVSINITEKKKLAEEVEKLALIASRTSNAVIFTDAKGHITWVNKGFEQISEYTLDEVLGKKPGDFLQGPDTDQETIAKMDAGLRNEKGFKVELLNYSKSGKKYWLDIEVQPLRSDDGALIGFMAIESEITSLKKAVEEMQKSEQALQTFMDYAPMVAFIKDLQGRYTFYNKMYRDFMKDKDLHAGYTDYDIFDKEFSDWCRGRDKHIVDTGETLQFEHFVQGQTFLEFKFPLKDALNNTFAVGGISLNITEKLEAQKKIAENEERLRSITNNLSDGVLYQYVVNAEGGIESFPYASSGVQELFEITPDMLAKDPMLVFNMVHPEDLEVMLQKGEHSRNTLSTFEHEYRISTPSGKIKWIHTRSNPQKIADGKTMWDGLSINITKRKKLELALQASEAKLQGIFQTMISGVVVVDVNGEITYANQSASEILCLESEEIEHRYYASKDWKQVDEAGELYPQDQLPLAIALKNRQPATNIEHGIVAPGEKVKWLNVNAAPLFDYKGSLIGAVASFLDVTKRKKAEQSLQNVYDELNAVLNASTDSTFLLDSDLRIRSFNKSAELGALQVFKRQIKIGDSILDITPSDLVDDLKRNFKKALGGEPITVEREIEFAPGFKYWNQIRYLPVRNTKNEVIGVSFNASDISVRKKAEQELFQSKRYFESLVNSQSSFLIRTDLQGNYTFANQKFYEKFGLQPENVIGSNALDTILKEDQHACLEVVAKCLENPGHVYNVSLKKPNPAGGYFWTAWEYVALQDEAGNPICIQCVGLDTTEQKERKIELERVHNRLLLATQSVEMGIWDFNVKSQSILWDSQLYKLFGVDEKEQINYTIFNELVHEEDRTYVNQAVARSLQENTNFDIIFRINRKSDGEIRFIKGYGTVELDVEGSPIRMVGVNYDVTELELSNQMIRESKSRLQAIFDNAINAIILADDNGNYLDGNESACAMLGYSHDELVKLNVAQVAVLDSMTADPFNEFLKEGRQAGFIDLKGKDAKVITTRYNAVANILPGVHLSIMEDITARRTAEMELIKSNRLYLVTSQINQMVVHAHTKKEVYDRVCEIAIEYGKFRMAWIGLVNTEKNVVEPLVWSGHEDHYFETIPAISILDIPEGRGPTGRAAREKRIVTNNNIQDIGNDTYNLWREEALKRRYESSIAIPIMVEEKVIAILTLYKDEPDFFTEKEIRLLQEVTENISFAIQTIDAEFDRQQKAIALAESEQRFRTLVRDLTIGVLVQGLNAEIISSNQAGLDLLGLTEEQLIGMTAYDPRWGLVREDGKPFPLEELPVPIAIKTKKSIKGVVMGVNRPTTNDRIWLLVDVLPRFDDHGEVINVIATLNNITELKEAEHVMQESRERIRVISDNLPSVAIYQFEEIPEMVEQSRYIYFSSGIEGITGISVQELLDNPELFEQHIHPDDQRENQRKTDEVNAALTVFDIEYRFRQKNGDWRWFRRRSQPSKMPDGRVLWNGVIIDVTDQKMVELQLIDALKEKDLLIKEVHHRVKNNLQLISSIIFIKMASMDPSESRDFLDNMRQRIRSVALIHERLLQTGSINQVNVSDYLMRLIRDLQVSMAQQDKRIDLKVDIQSTEINLDYAIHCGLIVNELVVNAYKHAFKSKTEGVITIQFKKEGNNCTLIVSDDGVSLPQEIKPGLHGSFGMELLEIFIKQLKAEVTIERIKGTKFEIDFKIES